MDSSLSMSSSHTGRRWPACLLLAVASVASAACEQLSLGELKDGGVGGTAGIMGSAAASGAGGTRQGGDTGHGGRAAGGISGGGAPAAGGGGSGAGMSAGGGEGGRGEAGKGGRAGASGEGTGGGSAGAIGGGAAGGERGGAGASPGTGAGGGSGGQAPGGANGGAASGGLGGAGGLPAGGGSAGNGGASAGGAGPGGAGGAVGGGAGGTNAAGGSPAGGAGPGGAGGGSSCYTLPAEFLAWQPWPEASRAPADQPRISTISTTAYANDNGCANAYTLVGFVNGKIFFGYGINARPTPWYDLAIDSGPVPNIGVVGSLAVTTGLPLGGFMAAAFREDGDQIYYENSGLDAPLKATGAYLPGPIRAISIGLGDPSEVVAYSPWGPWTSLDKGYSFNRDPAPLNDFTSTGLTLEAGEVPTAFARSCSAGRPEGWVGTNRGRLYYTASEGIFNAVWQRVDHDRLPGFPIVSISAQVGPASRLWVTVDTPSWNQIIWLSPDLGSTWAPKPLPEAALPKEPTAIWYVGGVTTHPTLGVAITNLWVKNGTQTSTTTFTTTCDGDVWW